MGEGIHGNVRVELVKAQAEGPADIMFVSGGIGLLPIRKKILVEGVTGLIELFQVGSGGGKLTFVEDHTSHTNTGDAVNGPGIRTGGCTDD